MNRLIFGGSLHLAIALGESRSPREPGIFEMDGVLRQSKVPEVTLIFWLIKILATTLGETGGDAVSMSMDLGYALSSLIFIGIFVVAVVIQISAKAFHPLLYWFVVIATTTAGTTMA